MSAPDTRRPIFDPHLDIATVVFSHVQCVKTRHSLARVSKLWREASKPAAAYPLEFDFDAFGVAFGVKGSCMRGTWLRYVLELLDNDEALSLPYERVVRLLGDAAGAVCEDAARRGSVRLLKWARENNLDWGTNTCSSAAVYGHLPALQYLHENGCPWDSRTCYWAAEKGHLPVLQYLHENGCPWHWSTCSAAADNGHLPVLQYSHENGCPWDYGTCLNVGYYKHWDCLQYLVDNKCPLWKYYAGKYAKHLR